MLKLDKFQKIADDGKTVTMRHDDGHEMRILVKALPHIQREQLKRLKLADGGKVQNFDDGTPDDTVQSDKASDQSMQTTSPDHSTTININPSPNQPAAASPPLAQPTQIPITQPNIPAAPAAVQPIQNAQNPNVAATIPGAALNLQQQSGNTQQAIDTSKSQANVDLARQAQENAAAIQRRVDSAIVENQGHANDMARIINAPENNNPKAFYENMSVPGKISTAIGILFGGMAGKGQGNIVMDYLRDQQEKDIAAQRQRSANAQTVWGAYNNLYHNENAATEMAKKTWNDKLAAQANQIAAQLGTPQASVANQLLQAKAMNDGFEHIKTAAYMTSGGSPSASYGPPAPSGAHAVEPSGGAAGKPKYGPESAYDTGVYNPMPILKPNAAAIMSDQARRAAAGDPDAAAQLPRLQEQYARAQKADEVLSRARDIYTRLQNNATPGGWTGRLAQHADLSSVPLVGGALNAVSQFAGEGVTGARKALGMNEGDEFSKNRQYESARQELGDLLRSVFPSIGGGEYSSKLNGIVPDEQDKRQDVMAKMKAFEDLVKTSGEFNVLKNKGLAN